MPAEGELRGKEWQPRDLAALLFDSGWQAAVPLTEALMVCLSESQGRDRSYNDNQGVLSSLKAGQKVRNVETGELYTVVDPVKGILQYEDGTTDTFPTTVLLTTSRDVGLFQINIPAEQIGTDKEEALYEAGYNVERARLLYEARGWQPWYGYTNEVYLRDTFLKKATRGIGNFLAQMMLERTPTDTLKGEPYVHSLKSPVLDYYYRVAEMAALFRSIRAKAMELKLNVTSPANKARCDEIARLCGLGTDWPKR